MLRKIRLLNKNARLYIIANFLISIGTGIFFLILNFYLRDTGISSEELGYINSYYYLGIAFFAIISGIISTIVGHKLSFISGVIIQAIAGILITFARNTTQFSMILFTMGIGTSLFLVNEGPFLSKNSTPFEQSHLFGLSFGSIIFGSFVGEIVGGFLPKFINVGQKGNLAIIYISISLILIGGMFLIGIEEQWLIQEEESLIGKISSPLLKILRNKNSIGIIATFSISEIFMGIGGGVMIPFFNIYFMDFHNLRIEEIGVIFAIQSVLIAISSVYLPHFTSKFRKFNTIIFLESASLPFILLLLIKNRYIGIISYLIRGILINASLPIYNAYFMELMDDEVKAIAASIKEITYNAAWFVGSFLFSTIKGDFYKAVLTFFLLYVLGIISFYALSKKRAEVMLI